MRAQLRAIRLLGFLAAGFLLAACNGRSQIPTGALESLNRAWAALPGSATHELVIVRAWRGNPPQDVDPAVRMPEEVWCVETRLASTLGDAMDTETFLWIATRMKRDAGWEATPLMVMSASWPYQACGAGGLTAD